MFCTSSDFDLIPYNIPNVDKVVNTLTAYINQEEDKALKKLLGVTLYNAFIEGLTALPGAYSSTVATVIDQQYYYGLDIWKSLTVTTGTLPVAGADWELIEEDNKWLRLRDGDTYTYGDIEFEWEGIASLLKPLIYSNWVRDNFDSLTGVGVSVANSENATIINPSSRIVNAWNDFAARAGSYAYGLHICFSSEDSLYGFLSENETDYPDWRFIDPGYQNTLGI